MGNGGSRDLGGNVPHPKGFCDSKETSSLIQSHQLCSQEWSIGSSLFEILVPPGEGERERERESYEQVCLLV